jgi:HD-GYP domain-containing protein (c-di-GMP phosphodiesterase class II)
MTSDRPYRKAFSFAQARTEIGLCSGTQFDPQLVKVFLAMPDSLWIDLQREADQAPIGTLGVKI